MSKTLSYFRTAFVGLTALLQLILLPATEVLHLGCQHDHGQGSASTVSFGDAVETTRKSCSSSHCCSRCSDAARVAGDEPIDSAPVQSPHDKDSCPLCQAVFAARIAKVAPVNLTTTEPICEFVAEVSQTPCSTPRFCVLSRGPPTALMG